MRFTGNKTVHRFKCVCATQHHENSTPLLIITVYVWVYVCMCVTAKRIILEMFLTPSHWEVASHYCTVSYVIMRPSVALCCIVSCQCSLMEGEKWLTRACDLHERTRTQTPLQRRGWAGRVELVHRAELHLLWPSPRGLTPWMLLTQADIPGSVGYRRTGNQESSDGSQHGWSKKQIFRDIGLQ